MGLASLFRKKTEYFNKSITPQCAYCQYSRRSAGQVMCERKGVTTVSAEGSCKYFSYSPLKRVPVKQLQIEGAADEEMFVEVSEAAAPPSPEAAKAKAEAEAAAKAKAEAEAAAQAEAAERAKAEIEAAKARAKAEEAAAERAAEQARREAEAAKAQAEAEAKKLAEELAASKAAAVEEEELDELDAIPVSEVSAPHNESAMHSAHSSLTAGPESSAASLFGATLAESLKKGKK